MVAASHWSAVPITSVGFAIVFEGFQSGKELFTSGGFINAILVKHILVVEEAMDNGSHRDAEDILAVVGDPGGLGNITEVFHAGQVGQRSQVALIEQAREASNGRQVIRSPAVPPSSLVFSTPLYSAGALGANTT